MRTLPVWDERSALHGWAWSKPCKSDFTFKVVTFEFAQTKKHEICRKELRAVYLRDDIKISRASLKPVRNGTAVGSPVCAPPCTVWGQPLGASSGNRTQSKTEIQTPPSVKKEHGAINCLRNTNTNTTQCCGNIQPCVETEQLEQSVVYETQRRFISRASSNHKTRQTGRVPGTREVHFGRDALFIPTKQAWTIINPT